MAYVLLIGAFALYFVPTYIAYKRRLPQMDAIAWINLLAGWTFVGWLVAFVMAVWNVETDRGRRYRRRTR